MMTQPLAVYRAVRTSDGQGGYTESVPALVTTVWGTIEVYENETKRDDHYHRFGGGRYSGRHNTGGRRCLMT